ncbi:hypothetical protein DFH11DRAFT_1540051 [Phellopilus nigrolimitatus]|nr:hypothetical protein DFH11DRAFT_1540051 [Phellopilus nigrolimitatus]
MAMKRKFDAEFDDATAHCQVAKQMKFVPFPSSTDVDLDVAMSEAPVTDFDSMHTAFHSRLPSSASTDSSDYSSDAASPYDPPSRASPPAGAQPSSTLQFTHSSNECTQIPKLRVACESGLNGQRSMFAMCEECGALRQLRLTRQTDFDNSTIPEDHTG